MLSPLHQRRILTNTPSVTSTPAARTFHVLSELNSVSVSASKPNCRFFNRPAFFAGHFFLPRVGAYSVIFRICHAAQLSPHVFSFWNSQGAFRREMTNSSLELNQELKRFLPSANPKFPRFLRKFFLEIKFFSAPPRCNW